MDWEGLKKSVRDEQSQLDRHMRELHALRASVAERYDDDKHLIEEVETDIRTKLDVIDSLCKKMNDHSQGLTTRIAHILRVKEMTLESRHELNRVTKAINDQVSALRLFGKKRLSRYTNEDDVESNLLRERGALASSLSIVDETIENARRAKSMIEDQTSRFIAATSRLDLIVSKIPLIKSVTSRIRSKSFKDTFILALVIGTCMFFIIWSKILSKIG